MRRSRLCQFHLDEDGVEVEAAGVLEIGGVEIAACQECLDSEDQARAAEAKYNSQLAYACGERE